MQSACSGGTGTFIEKTARKLQIRAEKLAQMRLRGYTLHKISSKCGIFAEADANTLVKAGVPVEEIIASLFEAVVYQNLATLTKGNTPTARGAAARRPQPVLPRTAGGLAPSPRQLWEERKVDCRSARPVASSGAGRRAVLRLPRLRRDRRAAKRRRRRLHRDRKASLVDREGPAREAKAKEGARAWCETEDELEAFMQRYAERGKAAAGSDEPSVDLGPVLVGCDFGSTTAKAVVLSPDDELLFSCYALSQGQSDRGREGVVPAAAAGRLRADRARSR